MSNNLFEENELEVSMLQEAEIEDDEVSEEVIPSQLSAEWSPFILSKFEPDELDEQGNPTVDGLRRITELYVGPIINSQAKVIQCASPENGLRATVEFTIVIASEGAYRTYTECADVCPGNVKEDKYALFPAAFAATRAEGRALRKALKLRKVVASEEVSDKDPTDALADAPIADTQLKLIDTLCRRLDIDAQKLLAMAKDDNGKWIKEYQNIPRKTAKKIIAKLNVYQQNVDNKKADPKDKIPPSVVGYVEGWRE